MREVKKFGTMIKAMTQTCHYVSERPIYTPYKYEKKIHTNLFSIILDNLL